MKYITDEKQKAIGVVTIKVGTEGYRCFNIKECVLDEKSYKEFCEEVKQYIPHSNARITLINIHYNIT